MKIVIGLLAAAILGTGGFAFAAGVDDTQPARTVSVPGTTTAATTAAATTDDIVVGNAPAATTPTSTEAMMTAAKTIRLSIVSSIPR